MSTKARVTRRDFLRTGATVGTGLTIAFYLPLPSRLADALGLSRDNADFAPNGWVNIGTDGVVTVTVDKSEMGQGILTAYPMLIAEELEVDPTLLRLAPTPINPAAWTRRMGTGGSSSVRSSYDVLRRAGAAAREMLIAAAAQQWAVDASSCRAEQGAVIHSASGRKLTYGQLASRAATLPVPAEPRLKDPREFRVLGRRVMRSDIPGKVNGTAQFGIDVWVPGMLAASIERSPVFGAVPKFVDDSKAKVAPGVRGVTRLEWSADETKLARASSGVAVVADHYWQALAGRRKLTVEWAESSASPLDSSGITDKFASLSTQAGVQARVQGDAASALNGAAKRIEAIYEVPYLAHAAMEPMNCTADVRADSCDVWAPTQGQSGTQQVACQITGLPPEKVRVHTTFLGGGFGRRSETDFVAEAVRLSKELRAPVKVIWTREDDTQHDFYRPATYNRFAAALGADGMPVAWSHHIVGASISLSKYRPLEKGIDGALVEGAANLPYAIPNILVEQTAVDLPIPCGYWRSVGSSHNAFVTECFFDEVVHAAGKDPYEMRRALLSDHPRHLAVLDLAADRAGWGKRLPEGQFRGIAVAEAFGSYVAEVADVSVSGDGKYRVHRVVCVVDCGPTVNPDTIEAQMQSGIVYGLSAALYGDITIEGGRVRQGNFNDYPVLRMNEMPVIEVHIIPSTEKQGGIGEPGVPPIAPAVCNAIFSGTGTRIRRLPIVDNGKARIATRAGGG
jgi:isoquinoline 1-oxidoreductase subunit beta